MNDTAYFAVSSIQALWQTANSFKLRFLNKEENMKL